MTTRLTSVVFFVSLLLAGTRGWAQSTKSVAIDEIVVVKSQHKMQLLSHGTVVHEYTVALSTVPVGAKERSGDHKVPEGEYTVDSKNSASKFHLALHVSYPNAEDLARAKKMGVDPGGEIEIHGLSKEYAWVGSLHRTYDWTNGCIAVTNPEIEEIYKIVQVGTKVEIKP
jgi:murein L,D-transpeptidase YafK